MRLTSEQLQEVMKKNGVDRIYSWSKIDTFINSPYEYFLKYVLHKKEDIANSAYPVLGGICHSIIEDYYNQKIEYMDMEESFEDGWTTAIDIADLKFDRNDTAKNESIKNKYKENLIHFFENHIPVGRNLALEKFVAVKIGNYLIQGYIDAIYKDDYGVFHIIDWKTSTQYKGNALNEKCGQLVVYAIALHEAGIPWDKLKICWNFLKYCNIEYQQKNGVTKTRSVERSKIGESLQSNAKIWLKECGYADQIDDYLKELLDTNDINVLPDDVKAKYIITDCYVYPEITQKLIEKWENTIISTIADIEAREKDYEETHNEKIFWDSEESVKAQSYYFANLCGYSGYLHKPYQQYLEKLNAEKNGDNTFNGIGSGLQDNEATSGAKLEDEMDLSWLDSI